MMARVVETEQKKKKSKIKTILIVLLVLCLIGGGVFLGIKFLGNNNDKPPVQEVKELDNLEEYEYILTDKDSKYFKREFEVLKGILNSEEVDVEKYTSQVAKMYVIDLYTLSTKVNKYDIGGVEYFHKDKKEMFEQKVMDTLYSTLLDNTYGDRIQELPEVTNIEVLSNEKSTYKLGKEEKDAYVIKLNITYDKDLGYDKEATVILCQDSDVRWSVVDYQPVIK